MSEWRVEFKPYQLAVFRHGIDVPLIVQNAQPNRRPFIHPLRPPDGAGILTEDAPAHHPWQHGLYTGLNDVNGVGFWCEGLYAAYINDGYFSPQPLTVTALLPDRVSWRVITDWHAPDQHVLLQEQQRWTALGSGKDMFVLRLEWQLTAREDLRFGQYAYGGLFLRMPYRKAHGGLARNSAGQRNEQAEGQPAQWVAVQMPIDGRATPASIAIFDHATNPDHPTYWRVDNELGIGPARCISGEWALARGESITFRYDVCVCAHAIRPQAFDFDLSL